jgi:hypothetical protein
VSWKLKRLPARYVAVVMPFVLSVVMSGILSFVSTVRYSCVTPEIVDTWLNTWKISWFIAFPVLLAFFPAAKIIAGFIVEQPVAPKPRRAMLMHRVAPTVTPSDDQVTPFDERTSRAENEERRYFERRRV